MQLGDTLTARVTAYNGYGASVPSELPSDPVQLVISPDIVQNLERFLELDTSRLSIRWQEPTSNGGSAIDSYIVLNEEGEVLSTLPSGNL